MPTPKDQVLFSVMILSIPNRVDKYLMPLYNKMLKQAEGYPEVEILCLIDNKSMTIGEKRQALLDSARGKWVGFMDDDDGISDDYIKNLHEAMTQHPSDVITFDQHCSVNGKEFSVNFRMGNPHDPYIPGAGTLHLKRPPYHMCFWRSEIAKSAKFKPSSYGEDLAWCIEMYPKIRSETHIDKVLHYYKYDDRISESIQYANK
jgi:glycosyltransferase involved in cell wall biosynthesis